MVGRLIGYSDLSRREKEDVWQEIRQRGLLDEALTLLESRVQENPVEPDLQHELGYAYLQKLSTAVDSEKSIWALKSDHALDAALSIDGNVTLWRNLDHHLFLNLRLPGAIDSCLPGRLTEAAKEPVLSNRQGKVFQGEPAIAEGGSTLGLGNTCMPGPRENARWL